MAASTHFMPEMTSKTSAGQVIVTKGTALRDSNLQVDGNGKAKLTAWICQSLTDIVSQRHEAHTAYTQETD